MKYRISLNQFSKYELENRQKNFLRGGTGCVCVCRSECSCGCLYGENSPGPDYYGGSSSNDNRTANFDKGIGNGDQSYTVAVLEREVGA